MFFVKKMLLGLEKNTFFLAKKVSFTIKFIISNDYENLLKRHLAKIKYGINSSVKGV